MELALAAEILEEVRRSLYACARPRRLPSAVVGSVRRGLARMSGAGSGSPPTGSPPTGSSLIADLDLLVFNEGLAVPFVLRSAKLRVVSTYLSGPRRTGCVVEWRPAPRSRAVTSKLDLFWAKPAERPYALFHYTGSWQYNVRIRAYAARRGLLLNQYGLYYAGTDRRARGSLAIRTEAQLARFLGVTHRGAGNRER